MCDQILEVKGSKASVCVSLSSQSLIKLTDEMKNKTQFQFKAEVNAEKALNNVDTGRVCTLNIKNFPKCGLRFPQKKKLTK